MNIWLLMERYTGSRISAQNTWVRGVFRKKEDAEKARQKKQKDPYRFEYTICRRKVQ